MLKETRKRTGILLANWFWYFMIYSCLGFLLEVAFARLTRNPKRDRKCFYFLPLCPVYGLGALLILSVAPLLPHRPVLLALWSALAATLTEYAVSLFNERALGVAFWDYSHLPCNLGGRVCLLFSLFWCGLGLWVVYRVHPLVSTLTQAIPTWITLPVALFLGLDTFFTIYALRRTGSTDALLWYRSLLLRQPEKHT